jgi:hypothetical protein
MAHPSVLRCLLIALVLFGRPLQTCATPPPPEVTSTSLQDIFTPRKTIPYNILGINAFANEPQFGTIRSQYREVKSTLGIRKVRILMAWNDQVQPSPSVEPTFVFYDDLVSALPSGVEALLILTDVPSWMNDSRNWIGGNPRRTFVEKWVTKVVARYARRSRVGGFQIWNEPNNPDFAENNTLDVLTKPDNYVELLALAHTAAKSIAPRKKVINGATTAIAQNYPNTLNYNKAILNAGALAFTDAFAIHYYGKNIERVLLAGGVADVLKQVTKPIWVTESGAQGINKQREHAERIFPFLTSKIPSIARIYLYQFTESSPASSTYGLRNLTPGFSISDLYILLRDRIRAAAARK